MNGQIRAHAIILDYSSAVGIAFTKISHDNKLLIMKIDGDSYEWVEHDPFATVSYTVVIPEYAAKELTEKILGTGIKPDQEAKNEGELKATKKHLEDMQKLTFKLLETKDSPK